MNLHKFNMVFYEFEKVRPDHNDKSTYNTMIKMMGLLKSWSFYVKSSINGTP